MMGQTCVQGTPSKKLTGAAAEAAAKVNKLLLHEFNVRVSNNPSTNLEELIKFKLKTYPLLRQVFVDSAVKAESTKGTDTQSGPPPAVREKFLIPSDVVVIHPLSMAVTRAAHTIRRLNDLILNSDILWHFGSTAVLGLTPNLALKLGTYIDVDHLAMLEDIRRQNLRVPIPDTHGVLQQTGTTRNFVFMSRVPGQPLDSLWKMLSPYQKADLRSLPFTPSNEPGAVYGGDTPRRCKDTRRETRVADTPISNEMEFNHFLSYNPRRTETSQIVMIRSYMTTGHELTSEALTGTDNLPSKRVTITGIIDWETCGWYPEYWEYLKALNTIFPGCNCEDWWEYLPKTIGIWPKEHAVDLMLDNWCR
ncbi:uncharacterized protein BO88DRAFT_430108 [Aspergillus vadensis CBS 113365]|uniref:Uncharacterized protein n=1 Tax=Aspergillus vadensis (strain CBS 113365 / IMI 142717 / IBT 24658) TaxID=1448311 RepID=A0A319B0Q2_ASPVC|nr:hypothetical protein BO88DRAFT_430108 [Aspergillus vadensis CBS 113365]PYH63730.1 hypothetical protein BO88DRAFT_430108 [Aspergillus vadensis CBS 113365]